MHFLKLLQCKTDQSFHLGIFTWLLCFVEIQSLFIHYFSVISKMVLICASVVYANCYCVFSEIRQNYFAVVLSCVPIPIFVYFVHLLYTHICISNKCYNLKMYVC